MGAITLSAPWPVSLELPPLSVMKTPTRIRFWRGAALLLTLLLGASACSTYGVRGHANGVRFKGSISRPPVPGGKPYSIAILIAPAPASKNSPRQSELRVDGVSFGWVVSGDDVEVTDEAKVLVNGEVRAPVTPQTTTRAHEVGWQLRRRSRTGGRPRQRPVGSPQRRCSPKLPTRFAN